MCDFGGLQFSITMAFTHVRLQHPTSSVIAHIDPLPVWSLIFYLLCFLNYLLF